MIHYFQKLWCWKLGYKCCITLWNLILWFIQSWYWIWMIITIHHGYLTSGCALLHSGANIMRIYPLPNWSIPLMIVRRGKYMLCFFTAAPDGQTFRFCCCSCSSGTLTEDGAPIKNRAEAGQFNENNSWISFWPNKSGLMMLKKICRTIILRIANKKLNQK